MSTEWRRWYGGNYSGRAHAVQSVRGDAVILMCGRLRPKYGSQIDEPTQSEVVCGGCAEALSLSGRLPSASSREGSPGFPVLRVGGLVVAAFVLGFVVSRVWGDG